MDSYAGNQLIRLLKDLASGDIRKALNVVEEELQLSPGNSFMWTLKGILSRRLWKMNDAIQAYCTAVQLGPSDRTPYFELFQHYEKRGQLPEAIEIWRRCSAAGKSDQDFHSQALVAMLKEDSSTNQSLLEEHRLWASLYARPRSHKLAHQFAPFDGKRPLNIGFVCSFWESDTIRFQFMPILRHHDARRFKFFAYNTLSQPNTSSNPHEIRDFCKEFRSVAGLTDDQFIDRVRGDEIDILVDLNGFSGGHRYAAMASRCAPIQATYLNYTSTTAVPNIDYVIADDIAAPPELDLFFTETIYRLPGCFFCFNYDVDDLPPVSPPPNIQNEFLTFGCFGSRGKITEPLIQLWSAVLHKIPGSRLYIRNHELSPPDNLNFMQTQFDNCGISADRLILQGGGPRKSILASYAEVDIALDTFPYGGGNTTAEALWQGVPVLTLRGPRFSSAYGASLLKAAGCADLIADTPAQYIDLAVGLSQDSSRLRYYRENLRKLSFNHGLSDARAFAAKMDDAYVNMAELRLTN